MSTLVAPAVPAKPRERVVAARLSFAAVALVPVLVAAATGRLGATTGLSWPWFEQAFTGLVLAVVVAVCGGTVLFAWSRLEQVGTGVVRGALLAAAVYVGLWSWVVAVLGD